MAATATSDITYPKPASQIKRLAWVIVWVSFMLFCSLSIAFSGGLYYFLFRSTVPMDVRMEVGRGSVGVTAVDYEQIVRNSAPPFFIADRPSTLTTDTVSQATLAFQAPVRSEEDDIRVIATMTLQNGSATTVQSARTPRFPWSDGIYSIELNNFSGEAEVFITEITDQPIRLRINTATEDAQFILDTVGHYSLVANSTVIRVTTHTGRALLVTPDNTNNRLAVTGEEVTLLTRANVPVVSPAPQDLIENGDFTFHMLAQDSETYIPPRWGCFTSFNAPPSGEYRPDVWNGRPAVRLIREVGDESSRTGCSQIVDTSVENYSYLELQVTVALNFQSLINCGIVGTECPMMMFVDYVDAAGEERTWYQGLFYAYDPLSPAPLFCLACPEAYEHRPIAEQVWYTFESGNLFTRLPGEERPVYINEVRFYASGHRYDVFVSDISLIAGTEQVIPPLDNVPRPDQVGDVPEPMQNQVTEDAR